MQNIPKPANPTYEVSRTPIADGMRSGRIFQGDSLYAPARHLRHKNIFQLAKIARRIPRLRARAISQLMRKRGPGRSLAVSAGIYWRNVLADLPRVAEHLTTELKARNIGGFFPRYPQGFMGRRTTAYN